MRQQFWVNIFAEKFHVNWQKVDLAMILGEMSKMQNFEILLFLQLLFVLRIKVF